MKDTNIKRTIMNNRIAVFTLLSYIVVLLYSPSIFIDSVKMTSIYFREMLEILPAVFIITGLVEVWVSRETIMKAFGEDSGMKGRLISVLVGSFSAGPIYAAFPVTYTLLKKGSSVSNVVIILSAWAVIKIPMLFVETQFMGLPFMLTRYIFTVPAIIGIGVITGKLISREQLIHGSKKEDILVERIVQVLPGHNCGACSFQSCYETAKALASGDVDHSACPVAEEEAKEELKKILRESSINGSVTE